MARQYKRDARGRFASGGSSGRRAGGTLAARASLRKSRQKLAAKDAADTSLKGTLSKRAQKAAVTKGSKKLREVKKASTVRLTKRGGTIGRPKGYVRPGGTKRGSAGVLKGRAVRPATPISSAEARKQSLEKGAAKSASRAKALEAKIARLEKEYRSKDSAFYTQGVKTAERDRMHAKMQQAVKLRDEVNRLKERSRNAEQQAARIKLEPTPSSSGNARLERAMRNQLEAGPRVMRKNKKQWQKRATAIRAQKVYRTGDPVVNIGLDQMLRPGFRLPRSRRR